MKILHIIHTPRQSGAELLVSSMSKIHSSSTVRVEIIAFCPPSLEYQSVISDLMSLGISYIYPDRPLHGIIRILFLAKNISRFDPDVIFCHSVLPSIYGRVARLLSRSRSKLVTVLHSACNDDFSERKFKYVEYILRYLNDRVIAVSELGKNNYVKRFGLSNKIIRIPNGIDISNFKYRLNSLNLHAGTEVTIVVQVGRIGPVKQQFFTIKSLRTLLLERKVVLYLVGIIEDKIYFDAMVSYIELHGLGDFVKILGARNDVQNILSSADIYVMPSTAEAHSLAILEALVNGLPVVASDISAFEFCKNIEGVTIVNPSNESDFKLAVENFIGMGRFNDRDIYRYSIDFTAESYLKVCRDLVCEF
jgi:glycosyltransferase involved in cell wall biosynthesis